MRFRVQGDLAAATVCNCSICTKKGFIHLIVPPEDFELLSGADDLATYQFNTRTAQHRFCRVCGMHPFYVPRSDPDKVDVNIRCLDDIDMGELDPGEFDGRHWEQAMAGKVPWRQPGGAAALPSLKWASLAAYAALGLAVIGLLARQSLLAVGLPATIVQLAAVALMIWARVTFGRRSFHAGADPTAGGLVTGGPYRYLRHPIYAAILYFLAAAIASHPGLVNGALGVLAAAAVAVRLVAEERLLSLRFPEYAPYAARTRRLVPLIF